MGLTVDTMVTELQEHLGLDSDELPTSAALLLLNRSWWDILNRFPLKEKEVEATFPTVAGTNLYELPASFDALRLISIEDLNDESHTPLNRLTRYRYESVFQNTTDAQGKPTDYLREGSCIRLYPTPDDAYTITIGYWSNLDDLVSGSSEPNCPREWHEIVLFGAIYRGFLRLKDYNQANATKAHQASLINSIVPVESKEEGDSHLSGLDVQREDNYT